MRQKKSGRWKIPLVILLILLAILAALAVWQKNNLQAVIGFMTYSQEELEEQLQQNDQNIKDAVNAQPEITVRDLTEEEKQALRDGSLSASDLANRLVSPNPPALTPPPPDAEPSAPPAPSGKEPSTPSAPEDPAPPEQEAPSASSPPSPPATSQPAASTAVDYETQVNDIIARVYVLREEYLIALEQMEESAKKLYRSLPSEKRTAAKLAPVVSDYLDQATTLEAECDAKMDAIVTELESLQRKNGKTLDLVKTVKYTYANEKSLKKAWYMSELKTRGLI